MTATKRKAKPKAKKAAEKPVDVAQEPPEEPQIDEGTWNAIPNYTCHYCPFSSLERRDVEDHYRIMHAPIPPPPSAIVVTDAHGNPVESEE